MQGKLLKATGIATGLLILCAACFLLQEKVTPEAIRAAYAALDTYRAKHPEEHPRMLAVVDYSKPSYLKRMVIMDLKTGEGTFHRVAHGNKSGALYARRFSDTPESNMSSLGLFRVLSVYSGDHGAALRLEGLEPGRNANAFRRDIVLHSADYVSLRFILLNLVTLEGPRIGRSNGCFVVSKGEIGEVTRKLAEGGFIYAWAEEEKERE